MLESLFCCTEGAERIASICSAISGLFNFYCNTSPLYTSNNEASVAAGSAAFATKVRKHQTNDRKCAELGRVVETHGCWGGYRGQVGSITACQFFSHASQLPKVHSNCIPLWTTERGLVRANVRALLSRSTQDLIDLIDLNFGLLMCLVGLIGCVLE